MVAVSQIIMASSSTGMVAVLIVAKNRVSAVATVKKVQVYNIQKSKGFLPIVECEETRAVKQQAKYGRK